jgi:predicted RNase H-like HicB family nuclease
MNMFTFTGILIKEDQGYSSLCPELDVASVGDTPEEAKQMLLEAAALHLEGAFEDGLPYLRPIPREADPRYSTPDSVAQIFHFKVDVAVHAYA